MRFFFKDAYHRLKRINPDEYNGASLLGLTAVVVRAMAAQMWMHLFEQLRMQLCKLVCKFHKNLGGFTTLLINKF